MSEYENVKLDKIVSPFVAGGKVSKCQAIINGSGPIELACYPDKVAQLTEGATIRAKYNPPKGNFAEAWFTVGVARASGGGGGWSGGGARKPDPVREQSIIRQCVFKGAIDLVCADKIKLADIERFIDKYTSVINGPVEVAQPAAPVAPPPPPAPPADDDSNIPF